MHSAGRCCWSVPRVSASKVISSRVRNTCFPQEAQAASLLSNTDGYFRRRKAARVRASSTSSDTTARKSKASSSTVLSSLASVISAQSLRTNSTSYMRKRSPISSDDMNGGILLEVCFRLEDSETLSSATEDIRSCVKSSLGACLAAQARNEPQGTSCRAIFREHDMAAAFANLPSVLQNLHGLELGLGDAIRTPWDSFD
jgi:hypothetical protein